MRHWRQNLVALITRRYPCLSGCGTLANSRLVRIAAGISVGQVWARLDCGSQILGPIDGCAGRKAFFAPG